MSHFVVVVVGNDPEKQLAPYQEQTEGLPEEFLEFQDYTDEAKKKYETGTIDQVKVDGKWVSPYDERFAIRHELEGKGFNLVKHELPEGLKKEKVPFKEIYPTFHEYAVEYEEYKVHEGRYGWWNNPNAKWDWYVLGGRWSGFFKIVENPSTTPILGEPGVFQNVPESGTSDVCAIRDIDFIGMRENARKRANEEYDLYEKATAGLPPAFTWSEVKAQFEDINKQIDEARKKYRDQPVVQAIEKDMGNFFFDDPVLTFRCTREQYVRRAENGVAVPFALLMDGKWYEKGDMGWWGMVSDEKDDDTWNEEYRRLIESLPVDTILSAYDCHI